MKMRTRKGGISVQAAINICTTSRLRRQCYNTGLQALHLHITLGISASIHRPSAGLKGGRQAEDAAASSPFVNEIGSWPQSGQEFFCKCLFHCTQNDSKCCNEMRF